MAVLAPLAVVLAVVLAYLPALRGGFVWDDDAWTTKLVGLFRDPGGLRSIWFHPTAMQQYYPLSGTTFWLDYQLWRFWPLPYHVENVALHTLAALLFWRCLRRLDVPGAWLAGALFALHPVNVESVAWIAERKNVLSLSLCLGAFLAYLRFAREEGGSVGRRTEGSETEAQPTRVAGRSFVFYALAWLLFLGALLAKTTVCALPAVILLLTWWRTGKVRWRQDVLPTLPFFAVALGMCVLTAWLEKTHVGARGPDYVLTLPQRFLIAGRAFWFYLGKLLWPANLCFVYPRWQPDVRDATQWLYPLAALGLLAALWQARRRIGRGPITALLFFAGTLSPLLGFVDLYFMRYSFVCNHWIYLPSLGPIAFAASGIATLLKHGHLGRASEPASSSGLVSRGLVAGLVLTLGVLTWREAAAYSDVETLWRTTLRRDPNSWIAESNLGNALVRRGRIEGGIERFREAIRLKPDLAEAHTSLGVALGMKGRMDEAIASFEDAIRVNPDYAEAHYDLGIALGRTGETDRAIQQFQEAIRLKPGFAAARTSLDRALGQRRRAGGAPAGGDDGEVRER